MARNVQFAINPDNGRMIVIEMNPRVSRSSALASKATGFPIAKIAAKLAVGYTLDEIDNDITRETPACFEPSIDYTVVKVPRWAFEKFRGTDETLTTRMKSVGEAMAIGRTFEEALGKAMRSLENGREGLGSDGKDSFEEHKFDEFLAVPNESRLVLPRRGDPPRPERGGALRDHEDRPVVPRQDRARDPRRAVAWRTHARYASRSRTCLRPSGMACPTSRSRT